MSEQDKCSQLQHKYQLLNASGMSRSGLLSHNACKRNFVKDQQQLETVLGHGNVNWFEDQTAQQIQQQKVTPRNKLLSSMTDSPINTPTISQLLIADLQVGSSPAGFRHSSPADVLYRRAWKRTDSTDSSAGWEKPLLGLSPSPITKDKSILSSLGVQVLRGNQNDSLSWTNSLATPPRYSPVDSVDVATNNKDTARALFSPNSKLDMTGESIQPLDSTFEEETDLSTSSVENPKHSLNESSSDLVKQSKSQTENVDNKSKILNAEQLTKTNIDIGNSQVDRKCMENWRANFKKRLVQKRNSFQKDCSFESNSVHQQNIKPETVLERSELLLEVNIENKQNDTSLENNDSNIECSTTDNDIEMQTDKTQSNLAVNKKRSTDITLNNTPLLDRSIHSSASPTFSHKLSRKCLKDKNKRTPPTRNHNRHERYVDEALSDFFDPPSGAVGKRKQAPARKRKSMDLDNSDLTETDASFSRCSTPKDSSAVILHSILSSTKKTKGSTCKKVRFNESVIRSTFKSNDGSTLKKKCDKDDIDNERGSQIKKVKFEEVVLSCKTTTKLSASSDLEITCSDSRIGIGAAEPSVMRANKVTEQNHVKSKSLRKNENRTSTISCASKVLDKRKTKEALVDVCNSPIVEIDSMTKHSNIVAVGNDNIKLDSSTPNHNMNSINSNICNQSLNGSAEDFFSQISPTALGEMCGAADISTEEHKLTSEERKKSHAGGTSIVIDNIRGITKQRNDKSMKPGRAFNSKQKLKGQEQNHSKSELNKFRANENTSTGSASVNSAETPLGRRFLYPSKSQIVTSCPKKVFHYDENVTDTNKIKGLVKSVSLHDILPDKEQLHSDAAYPNTMTDRRNVDCSVTKIASSMLAERRKSEPMPLDSKKSKPSQGSAVPEHGAEFQPELLLGFQSASGRTLVVNSEALDKATKLLNEEGVVQAINPSHLDDSHKKNKPTKLQTNIPGDVHGISAFCQQKIIQRLNGLNSKELLEGDLDFSEWCEDIDPDQAEDLLSLDQIEYLQKNPAIDDEAKVTKDDEHQNGVVTGEIKTVENLKSYESVQKQNLLVDDIPLYATKYENEKSHIGFTTVSGCKIELKEAAIAKAKRLLLDTDIVLNNQTIDGNFETTHGKKKVEAYIEANVSETTSGKCLEDQPECAVKRNSNQQLKLSRPGLKLQIGNNRVKVQNIFEGIDDELHAGNHFKQIESLYPDHKGINTSEQNLVLEKHAVRESDTGNGRKNASLEKKINKTSNDGQTYAHELYMNCERKNLSETCCFKTANEKKVTLNEEKIKKVEHIFDKNEINSTMEMSNCSGFTSARGKELSVNDEKLKKVKHILDAVSGLEIPNGSGFTSASGKKLSINSASLKKAENILDGNEISGLRLSNFHGFTSASNKPFHFDQCKISKAISLFKDSEPGYLGIGKVDNLSETIDDIKSTSYGSTDKISAGFTIAGVKQLEFSKEIHNKQEAALNVASENEIVIERKEKYTDLSEANIECEGKLNSSKKLSIADKLKLEFESEMKFNYNKDSSVENEINILGKLKSAKFERFESNLNSHDIKCLPSKTLNPKSSGSKKFPPGSNVPKGFRPFKAPKITKSVGNRIQIKYPDSKLKDWGGDNSCIPTDKQKLSKESDNKVVPLGNKPNSKNVENKVCKNNAESRYHLGTNYGGYVAEVTINKKGVTDSIEIADSYKTTNTNSTIDVLVDDNVDAVNADLYQGLSQMFTDEMEPSQSFIDMKHGSELDNNFSTEIHNICGNSNTVNMETFKSVSNNPNQNVGFSTASGNKIELSSKALLKAEHLLAEEKENPKPKVNTCNTLVDETRKLGFSSTSHEFVTKSDTAICMAKDILQENGSGNIAKSKTGDLKERTLSNSSFGFSTVYGKALSVSKTALLSAHKPLSEEDNKYLTQEDKLLLGKNSKATIENVDENIKNKIENGDEAIVPEIKKSASQDVMSVGKDFEIGTPRKDTPLSETPAKQQINNQSFDSDSSIIENMNMDFAAYAGNSSKESVKEESEQLVPFFVNSCKADFDTSTSSVLSIENAAIGRNETGADKSIEKNVTGWNESSACKSTEVASIKWNKTGADNDIKYIATDKNEAVKALIIMNKTDNSGKSVTIPDKALDNENQYIDSIRHDNIDKDVNISDKSLKTVKQSLVNDIPDQHDEHEQKYHSVEYANKEEAHSDFVNSSCMLLTASSKGTNFSLKSAVYCETDDSGNLSQDKKYGKLTNINEQSAIQIIRTSENSPSCMFQTASGKHVKVSENALKVAKQTLEHDEPLASENHGTVKPSCMFQTASGRDVKVSENTLKLAKQTLEHNDPIPGESHGTANPSCISKTASGRDVKLSENTLKLAKQTLEHDDPIPGESHGTTKPSCMFQTASGRDVKVSENTLKLAKQTLEHDDPIPGESHGTAEPSCMFQTASGRGVKVSENTLKLAKETLKHDDPIPDESHGTAKPSCMFQTASGRDVKVSENALKLAKETLKHDDPIPDESHGTAKPSCMFQTASGRDAKVSKNALKLAKETLKHDDPIPGESHGTAKPSCMFQTASGRGVKVPDTVLKLAKQTLEHNDQIPRESHGAVKPSCMFQTACGRDVIVSENALKLAKQTLEHDDLIPDESHGAVKPSMFQTASGRGVKVSENALKLAKQTLEHDDPIPGESHEDMKPSCIFQTAGGRGVKVSENVLKLAKQTLEHDDPIPGESHEGAKPSCMFQTASGRGVKVSENALQLAKQTLEHDDPIHGESHEGAKPSCMFQTASGRGVKVSENAMQLAKQTLEHDDPIHGEGHEGAKPSCMFQTASGRGVKVSENALQLAKQTLEHDDPIHGEGHEGAKPSCMFQTASGRGVKVSENAMQLAKQTLEHDDPIHGEGHECAKPSCMFQTASGRGVKVSENALQLAKQTLEHDDPIHGEGHEGAKPSCMFQTAGGRGVKVSENAVKIAKQTLEHDGLKTQEDYALGEPKCLFQTASGKGVKVSNNALKAAKLNLDINETEYDIDDDIADLQTVSSDTNNFIDTNRKIENKVIQEHTVNNSFKTSPFQTASEQVVEVSDEALSVARQSFDDEEMSGSRFDTNSGSDVCQPFTGATRWVSKNTNVLCQKASEKNLQLDNKVVLVNKRRLNTDENSPSKRQKLDFNKEIPQNTSFKSTATGSYLYRRKPLRTAPEGPTTDRRHPGFRPFKPVHSKHLYKPPARLADVTGTDTVRTPNKVTTAAKSSFHTPYKSTSAKAEEKLCSGNSVSIIQKKTPVFLVKNRIDHAHHMETNTSNVNINIDNKIQTNSNRSTHAVEQTNETSKNEAIASKTVDRELKKSINFKNESVKILSSLQELNNIGSSVSEKPQCASGTIMKDKHSSKLDAKTNKLCSGDTAPMELSVMDTVTMETSVMDTDAMQASFKDAIAMETNVTDTVTMEANIMDTVTTEASVMDTITMQNCDLEADSQDEEDMFYCNLVEARRCQEEEIHKRGEVKVRPQAGRLYEMKQTAGRWQLRDLMDTINKKRTTRYPQVTSKTLIDFKFNLDEYYGKYAAHVLVGDGAFLVPDDASMAGREEFYRAFLTLDSVDQKLVSEAWLYNHYRWLVWKLAAYETSSTILAGRCLTPEMLMLQLKYRYDREVDMAQRSALKKIYERDDTASKRLVLCVADVHLVDIDATSAGKPDTALTKINSKVLLELTDGWYSIKAQVDVPLVDMVHKGNIYIGQKLCMSGAELVGGDNACPPLEAPASIMLKIGCNSTRPASWDSKLGFQTDPRPLCVPLSGLYGEGGMVGVTDVVIVRKYPVMYMEKLAGGGCTFRMARCEEKARREFEARKQEQMEKFYQQMETEIEKEEKGKQSRGRKTWRRSEIDDLQSGQEIQEALNVAAQPDMLQNNLSDAQMNMLIEYKRQLQEEKQHQLNTRFQAAWRDKDEAVLDRNVTPVLKFRLAGCSHKDMDNKTSTIMTVWRPAPEVSDLQEGKRYKIYSLGASVARSKYTGHDVQFTATKQTKFRAMDLDENFLDNIYEPREVLWVGDIRRRQPVYGELDFVGLVIKVTPAVYTESRAPDTVYLADCQGNVLSIKFWNGIKSYGEDLFTEGSVLCCSNLMDKSVYRSRDVPSVEVTTEFTHITKNPQNATQRKAVDRLIMTAQDRKSFIEQAQSILENSSLGRKITRTTQERQYGTSSDVHSRQILAKDISVNQRGDHRHENINIVRHLPDQTGSGSGVDCEIKTNQQSKQLEVTKDGKTDTRQLSTAQQTDATCEGTLSSSPDQPSAITSSTPCGTPATPCGTPSVSGSKGKRKSIYQSKMSRLQTYGSPACLSPLNATVPRNVSKGFKPPAFKKF